MLRVASGLRIGVPLALLDAMLVIGSYLSLLAARFSGGVLADCNEGVFKSLPIVGAKGLGTRCYYSPPVHRHTAYRSGSDDYLPRTDWLAARVISPPLWRDRAAEAVETVADDVARVHQHGEEVSERGRAECAPS